MNYIEITLLIDHAHRSSHQGAQEPINRIGAPKDTAADLPFQGREMTRRQISVQT